jgi:hypothetical protein
MVYIQHFLHYTGNSNCVIREKTGVHGFVLTLRHALRVCQTRKTNYEHTYMCMCEKERG